MPEGKSDKPAKYRITTDLGDALIATVLLAIFFFWQQSGWYRLDCALGVQRACELIAAEKDYTPPSSTEER